MIDLRHNVYDGITCKTSKYLCVFLSIMDLIKENQEVLFDIKANLSILICLYNFSLFQIADFGLAKEILDYQTHVSTKLKGTFG